MGRKRRAALIFLVFGVATSPALAYKETTHADITKRATAKSDLNAAASGVLPALGLGKSPGDPRFLVPNSLGVPTATAVQDLLMRGAREEDQGVRSLRHFFDPQRDGTGLLKFEPSPTWALRSDVEDQEFDLEHARSYLLTALVGPTEAQRTTGLARVFLSLGHVVHHLQDMHQPQHVRGDHHCDDSPFFFFGWWSNGCASLPIVDAALHRPSAYEKYVWEQGLVPMDGYPTPDYATFDSARAFWENGGKGGAEFTSNNFVSARTNFTLDTSTTPFTIQSHGSHPLPRGPEATLVSKDINDPELVRRVTSPQPMAGDITLVQTPITDAYAPSFSVPNARASTMSIWYESFFGTGPYNTVPVAGFTLNSINYQAAMERLVPRATAYSTGLINYFFRGRIEITLPGEGVYGVIDHATTYATGQGFAKLKLKLRNASPDGVKPDGTRVPQTMQGGTLVAVAKYTLNGCYQPDLSGDYGQRYDTGAIVEPVNCTFAQYLAGEEQISQSTAILAASLDPATATEFTFDFASQPIPVNARDLRVQVVYTGTLGAEADAIAFGGRDISEPTHLVIYNSSDYFAVDGKLYTPAQIRSDPALSQRVAGLNIDPRPLTGLMMAVVPGKPIVGASGAVPVNGYVRVAVLANPEAPISLSVLSRFEGTGFSEATFPRVWPTVVDLRSPEGYITPYGIFRGPRGSFFDVLFKANSSAPLASGELVNLSGRLVADPGPTQIPVRF